MDSLLAGHADAYLRFLLMTFRVWFFNGAFRPHNPTPETPHEKW